MLGRARGAFCLCGGSGVVADGSPTADQESESHGFQCVLQNPKSVNSVSLEPPLWGSWEAALKVCLTFSPPLDLLSTEPGNSWASLNRSHGVLAPPHGKAFSSQTLS